VVDHGVGLSLARIEEENRRLVERERLDVARPGCWACSWWAASRGGTDWAYGWIRPKDGA
jgi:hypothetical protein